MGAPRRLIDPSKPVAFMFGLPMTHAEALAYMDHDAGTATPAQYAVLQAWKIKMTLVHGTWVSDDLRFLQTSDGSQA